MRVPERLETITNLSIYLHSVVASPFPSVIHYPLLRFFFCDRNIILETVGVLENGYWAIELS